MMVFVLVVTNMKLTKEVRLAVTHPRPAASYLQRAVFAEVGVVVQIGYFFNLVYLFIILWLVMA